MNKWVLRLVGVLILGVLAILFYDVWFRPQVPDALQDEISLQVGDETPVRGGKEQGKVSDDDHPKIPEPPSIELTSLEDQNAPAVLSNPHPASEQAQNSASTPRQQPPSTVQNSATNDNSTRNQPITNKANTVQGGVWVQVGSFADNENAQKMVAEMQQRQWSTDTEVANVNGKSYHRVFVGPLAASDVPEYLQQLQAMGINAREVTR